MDNSERIKRMKRNTSINKIAETIEKKNRNKIFDQQQVNNILAFYNDGQSFGDTVDKFKVRPRALVQMIYGNYFK